MKIIGIDPGLERMGFGVIEAVKKQPIELSNFGFLSIPRNNQKYNAYLNEAIAGLTDRFPQIVNSYAPELVAAETVPVGRLGRNTELVVAAVTTLKVICHQFGIEWVDLASNSMKALVVGDGKASKAMIKNKLFEVFPSLREAHVDLKKQQKGKAEKASGLPADVFDGIGIAIGVGIQRGGLWE